MVILRRLEKILTLKRHIRSTWLIRSSSRKMLHLDKTCYHTKYYFNTTWRFEEIRSQNYNELYIGKTFGRFCDVTSGPIYTVVRYFFIATNFAILLQIWSKSDKNCGNKKNNAFPVS